mgnify:CR=1 FL=1
MIMGFPGSTSRYLTESEVRLRMEATNVPRIEVREARQNVLRKEMAASDKVRIQYASKFSRIKQLLEKLHRYEQGHCGQ